MITEISIAWSIEDVQEIAPDLTKEEMSLALEHMCDNHDANIGFNWDVLRYWADWVRRDRKMPE